MANPPEGFSCLPDIDGLDEQTRIVPRLQREAQRPVAILRPVGRREVQGHTEMLVARELQAAYPELVAALQARLLRRRSLDRCWWSKKRLYPARTWFGRILH